MIITHHPDINLLKFHKQRKYKPQKKEKKINYIDIIKEGYSSNQMASYQILDLKPLNGVK